MQKIDLKDVSFLIVTRIESPDRLENLSIILTYLLSRFDTTVHVLESDSEQRVPTALQQMVKYTFVRSDTPFFHRTALNNQLLRGCLAGIAVLYDTDVLIAPDQLMAAVAEIRQRKYFFSLPYDGRFLMAGREVKKVFRIMGDIDGMLQHIALTSTNTHYSVGGCFMCDVAVYRKCGWENEQIEGWGHDDAERMKRIIRMGYNIYRPAGPLIHLFHERKQNSYFFNREYAHKSFNTYFETCAISKQELERKILLWEWTH